MARRVDGVRQAVAEAAQRSGRREQDITLVAVSKTVAADQVRLAHELGLRHFGENRVQELARKRAELEGQLDCTWHLIGHLQSNKAKDALRLASLIHSVDGLPLARELDRRAGQQGMVADILVQVNISGEESKSGTAPDAAIDLIGQIGELPHLRVRGLMTIAQPVDDPEDVRPAFRAMRQLFNRAAGELRTDRVTMEVLSMGMSHDFAIAIEEGATLVRVGTAIFGARSYAAEVSLDSVNGH